MAAAIGSDSGPKVGQQGLRNGFRSEVVRQGIGVIIRWGEDEIPGG